MDFNINTDEWEFPFHDGELSAPDCTAGEEVQPYISPSCSSWNEHDMQNAQGQSTYPLPISYTTSLTGDSPSTIPTPTEGHTTIDPAIISANSRLPTYPVSGSVSLIQSYDWPSFARRIFQEAKSKGSFPCATWYQSGQNAKGEYTTYKMPKPVPRTEETLGMVVCESMSANSVILKYPRIPTWGSLGESGNARNKEEEVQRSFRSDEMLVWLSTHSVEIPDNSSERYRNVFTKIIENETTGESYLSRQTDRRYFREKPLKLLSIVASHICHTCRTDLGTLTIRELEEYPEAMRMLLSDGTRALLEEASRDERWGVVSIEGERMRSTSGGKKVYKVQKKKSGGGSGKKKNQIKP